MYRRITTRFCESINTETYHSFIVRENDVAIKTSYSYISVTDIAIAKCNLVADSYKVLGSIAIGKVVDRGVNVNNIYEGHRAIVYPIHSPHYLYTLGGAQDIIVIDQKYAKVVEFNSYNDLEIGIIATLSVDKEFIDYVKGKDIVLIGDDISLIVFAYYASKYSCRIGITSRSLDVGVAKAEHISLYSTTRLFDVLVIASTDPATLCLAVRNLANNNASLLLYPYLQNMISGSCIKDNNISINVISFGDIDIGLEVFETYRDVLVKRIKVIDIDHIPKSFTVPIFIRFS